MLKINCILLLQKILKINLINFLFYIHKIEENVFEYKKLITKIQMKLINTLNLIYT